MGNGGQTMLFSLLGGAIALNELTLEVLYLGAAVVSFGVACRLISVPIVLTLCNLRAPVPWNKWEIIYTAISWCPKATVQAALSTVALEYVEANLDSQLDGEVLYNTQRERAMLLFSIAVLSIVMTAPL